MDRKDILIFTGYTAPGDGGTTVFVLVREEWRKKQQVPSWRGSDRGVQHAWRVDSVWTGDRAIINAVERKAFLVTAEEPHP